MRRNTLLASEADEEGNEPVVAIAVDRGRKAQHRHARASGSSRSRSLLDLLRALIGVANVATSTDWQQSARRLVDILITGSRRVK
jgi:hypothetical protein